jgi:hypothetical protein
MSSISLSVRKDLIDYIFQSYNHPLQRIQILQLQVNAQYPSRLTNWIRIKCLLGRLMPCDWCLSPKYLESSYIQRIYLLLIEYSLRSSLDPFFHSDSMIERNRCKGNECISILLSKWNRSNIIWIVQHHSFYWILRSLFMHDMIRV